MEAAAEAQRQTIAQSSGYSMFGAFHGGRGGSTAAILAVIFVKAGAELAPT